MGLKEVFKNGKWSKGKAAPEDIGELAKLPSEWVTKDEADNTKIHALDPEHIRGAIIEEKTRANVGGNPTPNDVQKKYRCAKRHENVELDQLQIDFVRMRVLHSVLNTYVDRAKRNEDPKVEIKHIWFPKNNVNNYELKSGLPPVDKDRPKHLRGWKLEIDVFNWPERIVDILKDNGITPPTKDELLWTLNKKKSSIIVPS